MKEKLQQNKYQMGQKVWFMTDNQVKAAKVTAIILVQKKYQYFVDKYDYGQRINCNSGFTEEEIFATKESLLKSL